MWNNSPPIKKYTQPFVPRMNCQKLIFQSGEMTDFRIKSSRKSRWMERLSKCIATHPHHYPSSPGCQEINFMFENKCRVTNICWSKYCYGCNKTDHSAQQRRAVPYLSAWLVLSDVSSAKLNQIEMALLKAQINFVWVNVTLMQRFMKLRNL